jgi:hypothetical protein
VTTRPFHLGDVLTITTGRLVSPRHMDGVYDVLNFMTGDNLFTHQLPRACEECAPELLRQHPQLRDVSVPDFSSPDHVPDWLAEQVIQYGETLALAPLAAIDHTRIDPLTELAMMRPDASATTVVVVLDDEASR